jgi:[methyl-Co(III) methanol-specific corrinoid protein]:coenzyme M methyltransferase
VVKAIEIARRDHPDVPVIGRLTGPVSTAASIVSPLFFLKDLRRAPEACHALPADVVDVLELLGGAMIEAGADVIGISDPTATGEILGPHSFDQFAKRWLVELVDRLHRRGAKVIVHICGSLSAVQLLVVQLRADALSTDSNVSLVQLKNSARRCAHSRQSRCYWRTLGTQFGRQEPAARGPRRIRVRLSTQNPSN